MKKALVISGGGSKGAFAGGVAEYLINIKKRDYDFYIGSSTGSLMLTHLALNKIEKLKKSYTSVNQNSIFSVNPFKIKTKKGITTVAINHFNVIRMFLKGCKTFGESKNLKKLITSSITRKEFEQLKKSSKETIITVSNLSKNRVEYKSNKDFTYEEYCDWIWISCNLIPFMSLTIKNNCEYADGGLGCVVPIDEAIRRGAEEIDVIILQTEMNAFNRLKSKNAFSVLISIFEFMLDKIEVKDINYGKIKASYNNVILNLYYTPNVLTTNSLVFDKKRMARWWKKGFIYAKKKNETMTEETNIALR